MSLSGQQRRLLQSALMGAFPTLVSLEQMLSFRLNKNLRAIAGEGSLQEIVFKLIQIAEAQGWLEDLVCAARKENSGNALLQAIAQELLTGETQIASSPNVPQAPSRFAPIPKPRSTQRRKILVSGASVVVIFLLNAYGITLQLASDLSSEKGVDYTRLRDLLKAGKWKDADYETYLVMLKVEDRKENDTITYEEMSNFPCTDLRTIDNLWVKYSNRRFGFSIQKKIYLESVILDGYKEAYKLDGYYYKAWKKFGDAIGWRVNQNWIDYSHVTFDTTAPEGHLPNLIAPIGRQPRKSLQPGPGIGILFSRIKACKV